MSIDRILVKRSLLMLFLVFGGIYIARPFLVPLVIGLILSALFLPLAGWLERKKIPRGWSSLICLLVLISFVAGITALLASQVSDLVTDFPAIRMRVIEMINSAQHYIFSNFGIPPTQQVAMISDKPVTIGKVIPMLAGSFLHLLVNLVLVPAYVILLLYYRTHLRNFVLRMVPAQHAEEAGIIIANVSKVSHRYVLGLAKMIGLLWVMYGLGFSLLGVENALFFAVLCGLLEIVPFVGNLTGTALTLLVAAANGGSPALLFGILCVYGSVQFIQGWFLEPLILGPQVRINPLFTIIALVIGQLLWGLPGVLLAIPLVAMLKIICDHIDSLKPFGYLVGETDNVRKKRKEKSRLMPGTTDL
jgi:predicted PurR-regulated permease PerM